MVKKSDASLPINDRTVLIDSNKQNAPFISKETCKKLAFLSALITTGSLIIWLAYKYEPHCGDDICSSKAGNDVHFNKDGCNSTTDLICGYVKNITKQCRLFCHTTNNTEAKYACLPCNDFKPC